MRTCQTSNCNFGAWCLNTHFFSLIIVFLIMFMSSKLLCFLFQSNFLADFACLNPKKSKKSKGIETLWLELLLNLSFSMEGQQMILKISGTV